MASSCAICGDRVAKDDRVGVVDCYMVHQKCGLARIPFEDWHVNRKWKEVQGYLDSHRTIYEDEVQSLRKRLAASHDEVKRLAHEKSGLGARSMKLASELDDAREQVAALLESVSTLRRRAMVQQQVPERLTDTATWRFMADTIGASVGRGVWGIASYYARKLDIADDAVARFRLLDLY